MATRIEALASFSNSDKLNDIGGVIATGQTAVVDDEYAEELERLGLAEITDSGTGDTEDEAEADSDATTSTSSAEEETTGEETTEEKTSEESASGEEPFEHTDYIDEFATLTEELPHHDVLAESDITTFDDLAAIADDFQVVNGIGPAKAEDLSDAWDEIVSS